MDSDRFIIARKQAGLSQEAVARRAGISAKTVSRLENGLPVDHASRLVIASVLGIKVGTDIDENVDGPVAASIRIPLFDRDVSAGWAVVPDDLSDQPDGWLIVPPYRNVDARDIWALRIRGDSMLPLYPSGSRVILARVRYYERNGEGLDCAQIEVGQDYYVCLSDGRQTFKQVVSIDLEALTLRARNEKRYPESFRIPCDEVVNLSKRIGVLDPE